MDYFNYYFRRGDVQFYISIVIVVAVAVLLFLLLRFICCWYFKINARIKLLEKQNSLLEEVISRLDRVERAAGSTQHTQQP